MKVANGTLNLDGTLKLRGGTRTALSSINPLPAAREIIVETDTGRIKVGDGIHQWNSLPYAGQNIESETWEFELEDGSVVTKQVAVWTSQV